MLHSLNFQYSQLPAFSTLGFLVLTQRRVSEPKPECCMLSPVMNERRDAGNTMNQRCIHLKHALQHCMIFSAYGECSRQTYIIS